MKKLQPIFRLLFGVMLVFPAFTANAQIQREKDEKIITDLMERFIENQEANIDYTDLQEQLEYYQKNKLNLNTAGKEELARLFFLTEKQIAAIIKHRSQYGDYVTIFELQTVDALDELTIYYLSYFVTVDTELMADQTKFAAMFSKGKHEVIALHENDFQTRAGYDEALKNEGKTYYLGSPYRYVLRYRFSYANRLSFGYTGEKDMGEQFFNGAQKSGFDFNSFHFLYRPQKSIVKTIALGDYQANFGQGLVFGSGVAARKSAFVMSVKRNYQTLRPYRSLNENEFLRGAALTLGKKSLQLTSFISHKYISTNYRDVDTIDEPSEEFSSFQISGLHRTANEILNRYNVLQTIYGGHLAWQHQSTSLGLTAVHTSYDKSFVAGDQLYQLYQFSGSELTNLGFNFSTQLRNANLFGEVGRSSNDAWALTTGMMVPLDDKLDLLLLYRNYSKAYQTTFSNPFGENTDGRNEEGLYTGVSLKLSRQWVINTYFDIYRSPWLRYQTDAPSRGYDYLAEVQFNPSKTTQLYIRYRHEDKWRNQSGNTAKIDYIASSQRDIYRFHIQYKINATMTGKTRLEHTQYYDEINQHQQGTLVFQDINYSTPFKKLTLTGRIALFSVEDYNARIFASENDVLYQFAVPLYQNAGVRYYLLANYSITRRFEIWIKYSQTTYNNKDNISSGLEAINGNTLSEMRVQARYTF